MSESTHRQDQAIERKRWSFGSIKGPVSRLSSRFHTEPELTSVLLVVVLIVLLVGNIVVTSDILQITSPRVGVRSPGDPLRGRERIVEENLTTVSHLDELAANPMQVGALQMVYRHAPLLLHYGTEFPSRYSTPIGVYYQVSESRSGNSVATTIRYYLWFTDEEGGMPIDKRLSMFGHSMDRELMYRVTLLGDEVVAAYYQAPGHRLVRMNYPEMGRPVFAVASANHNFRLVTPRELDGPGDRMIIAMLPRLESPWAPAHDPDFAAIATDEVWEKYGIDLTNYVFVELELPSVPTPVTISVRIGNRWHYLHEQIGGGVRRPGYNQVGIDIGYSVLPGDIQEVRIVSFDRRDLTFEPIRVTIYPRRGIAG